MKIRWYVGYLHSGKREAFKATPTPSAQSHPQYWAVMGPFTTKRGAKYKESYGFHDNPHLLTVADCEFYAKREEDQKKQLAREFLQSQANLEVYPD